MNHYRHPSVTAFLGRLDDARAWASRRTVCRWVGHNTKRRKMRGFTCSRCNTFTSI